MAKIDYREIAFKSGDPELDTYGWDMICEGAECWENVQDCREAWKFYQNRMNLSLESGKVDEARFYAWCMLFVEGHVKRMGW